MNIIIQFKNLVIESLKDNKKLIIVFYALFIFTFIVSWILSISKFGNTAINTPVSNSTGISAVSATELFIHNEYSGIITYISSVFFGIFAVIMLIYNALNLGTLGALFNSAIPNGGIKYIVYLIPHGIFEITATVLQSVAGIMLFLFIWRFIKVMRSSDTNGASQAFEKTKKVLIQSIIIMIFATILLLIAAPIEAYFSVPFSDFIVGS